MAIDCVLSLRIDARLQTSRSLSNYVRLSQRLLASQARELETLRVSKTNLDKLLSVESAARERAAMEADVARVAADAAVERAARGESSAAAASTQAEFATANGEKWQRQTAALRRRLSELESTHADCARRRAVADRQKLEVVAKRSEVAAAQQRLADAQQQVRAAAAAEARLRAQLTSSQEAYSRLNSKNESLQTALEVSCSIASVHSLMSF
jgi:chromosome segregation ATPase